MPVRSAYIDVDGTIADDKLNLFPGVKEKFEEWYKRQYRIYVWSHGGAEHAKYVCESNGIAQFVVAFMDKPDVIVDDNPNMILTFPAVLQVNDPGTWWSRPDRDLFRESRKHEKEE